MVLAHSTFSHWYLSEVLWVTEKPYAGKQGLKIFHALLLNNKQRQCIRHYGIRDF